MHTFCMLVYSSKYERIRWYNCINATHKARDSAEAIISLQVDSQISYYTINALATLITMNICVHVQILNLLVYEHKFSYIIVYQ